MGARAKARARARLLAQRKALVAADVQRRGAAAQARLLSLPAFAHARTIALYAARPQEVPTGLLLVSALAQGKRVVFPVVPGTGRVLGFRQVQHEEELVPQGRLAIAEPVSGCPEVELSSVDFFVVPGLGFSRLGQRLGHGRGYYDATLARASAASVRVGLAFSEALSATLPTAPGDVPMHWVVTEGETIAAEAAPATVVGARPADE